MVFAAPHDTVLITDGGLATELEARGHDLSDDLWSARLLVDAPEEIVAVHCAFFRAGASSPRPRAIRRPSTGSLSAESGRYDAARLLRRSVELAKAAATSRRSGGTSVARWVAASVGPYGAALANGEEYLGRYGLSVAQLADWHRPRLEILADAGADVLALETVPDVDEAEALVGLVHELGVPAWLSYTIAGPTTRAGQPLADAFAVAAGVPEIVAVGVNCCAPDDVEHAIEVARGRQASPSRLPQQRRRVGRRAPDVDRTVRLVGRTRAALGRGGRTHHRRVLPGTARATSLRSRVTVGSRSERRDC